MNRQIEYSPTLNDKCFPLIEVDENIELTISQAYVSDVGGVVWDAALVLNAYIGILECNEK